MLSDKQLCEIKEIKVKAQIPQSQPDDLIDFYHLKSRKGMSQLELENERRFCSNLGMSHEEVKAVQETVQRAGDFDIRYSTNHCIIYLLKQFLRLKLDTGHRQYSQLSLQKGPSRMHIKICTPTQPRLYLNGMRRKGT
ncbi:hypothetical protein ACS0TY_002570 [Phlomoides rotata]